MSTKQENIRIWRDTVYQCLHGKYQHCPVTQSIPYADLALVPVSKYLMTVDVVNMDTFSCCHQLISQGYNVLALNMANSINPGGGIEHGSFAQEENCFRRSNYFLALPKIKKLYPIPDKGCLYTPLITVIKDPQYQPLKEPFGVSMIACAALCHPPLGHNGDYIRAHDRELMRTKIEQIFQVGLLNGHDCLVLGALGCGAFGNNPVVVSELFNEMLKKYWGCFKNVTFAVLSYRDNNYSVFEKKIIRTN